MRVRGGGGNGDAGSPRVGLFGLLGDGNIGNDASLESVLRFLRDDQPSAVVDVMCTGPARITREFGIKAVSLYWQPRFLGRLPRPARLGMVALGRLVDAARIASWAGRHDVVIVPGMGVLEASLPIRPWETPFAMFMLCASGRMLGTKVALVSVGATPVSQRGTRWLLNMAARMAAYRSYRDTRSLVAMSARGLDTSEDKVYPDLVFGLDPPPSPRADPGLVAVGVMTYHGTNDDRERAAEIHSRYLARITEFVQWLVDNDRRVVLLVGDKTDDDAVRHITAAVQAGPAGNGQLRVRAEPVTSFADLQAAMAPASIVVATRFHNVMCALRLGKPVVSLGYAPKNTALMAEMGLLDFCQHANDIDVELLKVQVKQLEADWEQLRPAVAQRSMANAGLLARQFKELSALLADPPGRRAPGRERITQGQPGGPDDTAPRQAAGVTGGGIDD